MTELADLKARGNCAGAPTELFFAGKDDPLAVAQAKAVCNGTPGGHQVCPVRDACLAFALEGDEFGVWGGRSERQRRVIRRREVAENGPRLQGARANFVRSRRRPPDSASERAS